MNFDFTYIALCITIIVIVAMYLKWSPTTETEVLRAAYRNLETQTRCAQEQAVLALHDLQLFREAVAEQREADRARISRCEVQVESNERNMVKLGNQFKDEVTAVRAEGTKLAMHVSNTQRKGF